MCLSVFFLLKHKTYPRITKVEVDGFGMTNVKNTIRFRRKSCLHLERGKKVTSFSVSRMMTMMNSWWWWWTAVRHTKVRAWTSTSLDLESCTPTNDYTFVPPTNKICKLVRQFFSLTIWLWAWDYYEVIIAEKAKSQINYHLKEI